jgi:hypothetical protein
MSTIPQNSIYSNIMDGYFGDLSGDGKNQIWQSFLQASGLTSNPATNDTAAAIAFSKFIQGTYNASQTLSLSPTEVVQRHLIFSVYQIILTLLKSVQQNVQVIGSNITFLGRYQAAYTDQEAALANAFYIASPTDTNTPHVNATDLSKWTLGFDNLTIKDYLKTAIQNGALNPPVLTPLTVGSSLTTATVNNGAMNITMNIPLNDSVTNVALNPINFTDLGISPRQAPAFTTSSQGIGTSSSLYQIQTVITFRVHDSSNNLITASVTVTSRSTETTDQQTQDIANGIKTLLGTTLTSGRTVAEVLNDPSSQIAANFFGSPNPTSFTSGPVVVGNFFTFTPTTTGVDISFTANSVSSGTLVSNSATTSATFASTDNFDTKLATASTKFMQLYNGGTVGNTSQLVSTLVADPAHPIGINWPQSQVDSSQSILTPPDATNATSTQQQIAKERGTNNSLLQQFESNIQSRIQVLQNQIDGQQGRLSQGQQEISGLTSVLNQTIQQLSTILSGLFR